MEKNDKKTIVFGGCGGMYNYYLGVASVLQKNFDLKDIVFSGSSAGCFPALLCALDIDIEDKFYEWNLPFLSEINSRKLGPIYHWNETVRKTTLDNMQENDYQKANGKLFCSLTQVPSFKNEIVGNWKSNDDLLDGVMSSAFIPIFSKFKMCHKFRDKYYLDGSLTNSHPLPFGNDSSHFIVKRDRWRENKNSWLWLWSDEEWVTKLFEWGKEDATNNLEEISDFLIEDSL